MERMSVDSYQVSIKQRAAADPRPTVLLKGTADTGNTPTTVWLYFEGFNQTMIDNDYMGLAFPPQRGNRKLTVQMPRDGFADIYDILRNESPTFFLFELRDNRNNPTSTTKLVTVAQLGTLDEIPGEGPEDRDA